jgi:hypothetical protein
MNATGMTVDTTTSTLVDDSTYTKPEECLAVRCHCWQAVSTIVVGAS